MPTKSTASISPQPDKPEKQPEVLSTPLSADFTKGKDRTVDPQDLSGSLLSLDEKAVVEKQDQTKAIDDEQLLAIIDRVAKIRNISRRTSLGAISALFRKGAANAGAPKNMSVDVICQDVGTITEVSKYDIEVSTQEAAKHKNVRKVAEKLAPEILKANLAAVERNPMLDLRGDLANRINKVLLSKQQDPLTRKEEICCCTFAQWMPNLNELADSKRLKALLNEDLLKRNKSSGNKSSGKNKGNPNQKAKANPENSGKK